jgi:hypothetical protein
VGLIAIVVALVLIGVAFLAIVLGLIWAWGGMEVPF